MALARGTRQSHPPLFMTNTLLLLAPQKFITLFTFDFSNLVLPAGAKSQLCYPRNHSIHLDVLPGGIQARRRTKGMGRLQDRGVDRGLLPARDSLLRFRRRLVPGCRGGGPNVAALHCQI